MFFLEYNNIDALQTSGKVEKKTKDAHTQPHLFVSRSRTLDSMNNRANVSYHWFNWRVLVQFICLNIKVITLYSWIWCYSASVLVFLLCFFFLCCHSFFEWYALRVDFFLSLSLLFRVCSFVTLSIYFELVQVLALTESVFVCIWRKMSCCCYCCTVYVQKIGFGCFCFFFVLLMAYFCSMLVWVLHDESEFNAFIIGCVYGFLYRSSNDQVIV